MIHHVPQEVRLPAALGQLPANATGVARVGATIPLQDIGSANLALLEQWAPSLYTRAGALALQSSRPISTAVQLESLKLYI